MNAPHLRVVPDDTTGKPPPGDRDAETAVLSAVMLDPSAMPKVIDFLRPEHFMSEAHRRTFEACVDLFQNRQPIDVVVVGSWLRARERLSQVGGLPYLGQILDSCPVVDNVRKHALAVHDMWRRRQVALACQRAAAQAHGPIPDVQKFVEGVAKTVALIGMKNPLRPAETNQEAIQRILADALAGPEAETEASNVRGFPTGLYGVDRLFWGLRPGAKTTVAALTGVGKTAFALQLALAVAKRGGGVLFFSTELRREELLRRALAAESCIASEKIKRRSLDKLEAAALIEAGNRINRLPLRIDETARITVEQIRAATVARKEESTLIDGVPLVLVVVDYVQRLATSSGMMGRPAHEQHEHATTELKILAQEENLAVLELAQAKPVETKGRKRMRPTTEDGIAGSRRIAKESDEVIFLLPLESDERRPEQEVEFYLAKQRDGRKGEVDLMFHRHISRFEDMNDPMRCGSRDYLDSMLEGR